MKQNNQIFQKFLKKNTKKIKINTNNCKSSSYICYTTGILMKIKRNKIGGLSTAIFRGFNT